MQIYMCTVEGAAQTNLQPLLPFWIAEDAGEERSTLLRDVYLK